MRLLHLLCFFCMIAMPIVTLAQNKVSKQRVTSIARYYHTPASRFLADSVHFSYSGSRGSQFRLPGIGESYYGFFSEYRWEQVSLADIPRPYADAYDIKVFYDTMQTYVMSGSVTQKTSFYNRYDENGRIELAGILGGRVEQRRLLQYSNDSLLTDVLYITTADSSKILWDTLNRRTITWDDKKRVASDLREAKNWSTNASVSYNSKGDCLEIYTKSIDKKSADQKEIFRYDASDNLVIRYFLTYRESQARWDTAAFYVDYNEKQQVTKVSRFDATPTTPYDAAIISTWHYDTSGKTDTVVNYRYDMGGLTYCDKTVFYYNAYKNPDSAVSSSYIDCEKFATVNYTVYYQYEEYFEELPDTARMPERLIIFPNPARDFLKIRWNKQRPPVPVYINLYLSLGQQVKKYYIKQAQPIDVIDINALTSGIYYIQIVTEGGGRLHTQALLVN